MVAKDVAPWTIVAGVPARELRKVDDDSRLQILPSFWYERRGRLMSLISIVVPVFHNASSLADLLKELQSVADKNADERPSSSSSSMTDLATILSRLLERLASLEPRMTVVKLSRKFRL